MAKSGTTSQVHAAEKKDAEGTRQRLILAAIGALSEVGFAGTSAREIARRAEANQALVFYHFGSVVNLLLAALDETSRVRMERYSKAVEGIDSLEGLVTVGITIFREDLDAGHVTVLAELIAGCSSTPGLGAEVSQRVGVWIEFTERIATGVLEHSPFSSLLKPADVAFGIVALYLGVELLTHLANNRQPAEALFSSVEGVAKLVGPLLGGA